MLVSVETDERRLSFFDGGGDDVATAASSFTPEDGPLIVAHFSASF
jgi:hypothetical protein